MPETEKGGVDFGFGEFHAAASDEEITEFTRPGATWRHDECYPRVMRILARLRDEMKRAEAAESRLAKVDEIARRKVSLGEVVENVSWLVAIVDAQDKAAADVWGHASGLHTWADTLQELKRRAESAEKERDSLREEIRHAMDSAAKWMDAHNGVEKERDDLRAEVEELSSPNRMKKKLRGAEADRNRMRKENERLTAELERLRAEVERLKARLPEEEPPLKPCPFCGGDELLIDRELGDVWVQCCGPDACCAGGPRYESESEAIAAWNRRAGDVH